MSAIPDEHTGMLDTTPDPAGEAMPRQPAAELSRSRGLIAEADAPASRTVTRRPISGWCGGGSAATPWA